MLGPRLLSSIFLALLCDMCPISAIPASDQIQAPDLQGNSQQVPIQSPARISGHVYRADTGEPLSDAVVSLEPLENGFFPQARTKSDGSFVISKAAPGVYNIEANAVGFLAKSYGMDGPQGRSRTVTLKPSQIIEGIDFRLNPPGAISGSVYDENGRPVAGVRVLAAHA